MKRNEQYDEVRQFLLDHIATHEQLQSLLLLERDPGRAHSPEAVSAALGAAPSLVEEALLHLQGKGLVRVDELGGFRFSPNSAELAAGAKQLARLYEQEWLAVLEMMGENSIDRIRGAALRVFSDAFLLARKK
jgi:DNA-binding GntR family transcriptional regulator